MVKDTDITSGLVEVYSQLNTELAKSNSHIYQIDGTKAKRKGVESQKPVSKLHTNSKIKTICFGNRAASNTLNSGRLCNYYNF